MQYIEKEIKDLISAREVRELLGVSRQRVNQLRNEGKLHAVKHGIWLYDRSEVLELKPSLRVNRRENRKYARK